MTTLEKFNADAAFVAKQVDEVTNLRRQDTLHRVELMACYERIEELESSIRRALASGIAIGPKECIIQSEVLDLLHEVLS